MAVDNVNRNVRSKYSNSSNNIKNNHNNNTTTTKKRSSTGVMSDDDEGNHVRLQNLFERPRKAVKRQRCQPLLRDWAGSGAAPK